MATLPADRTKLALAQGNQVASTVASASKNINAMTEAYDTIDLLNNKVNGLLSSDLVSELGIINVKDYNASGSANTYTGTIASGSRTLTLTTSSHDFVAGQGISIPGAGAAAATLVTTVSAVSGATVTVATAASTTATSVTVKHDDSVAITAAQTAAAAVGGCTVFFPAGTYKITGSTYLSVTSGSVIWEGVPGESILDFTSRTTFDPSDTGGLIRIVGSLASAVNLSSNTITGSDTITITSTSGISHGDLLLVTSNDDTQFPGDVDPPYIGQLSEVFTVDSGTQLTMAEKAYSDYTTASSAYIQKVSAIDPVYISGISFIGQGHPAGAPSSGGDIGLRIDYARNVTIRDCKFIDIDRMQLVLNGCYHSLVENCDFHHPKHDTEVSPPVQYQVRFADGSAYGTVANCRGVNSRHFFNAGHRTGAHGISRFIKVSGCTSVNTWHAGYSTHNSSEYVTFDDCTANNCRYGFNLRERNTSLKNSTTKDCEYGVIFTIRPQSIQVSDCEFYGGKQGVTMLDTDIDSGFITSNLKITNNFIDGVTEAGIMLQNISASAMCKGLKVEGNEILNVNSSGNYAAIRIYGKFNGSVDDNTIQNVNVAGIRIESGTKRLTVRENTLDDIGTRGIHIVDSSCEDTFITGNLISDCTTATITDAGTRTTISGNDELTGAI